MWRRRSARRRCAAAGSVLARLASHVETERLVVSHKVRMSIRAFEGTLGNPLKAIVIQLALKASILCLRKELG